MIIHLVTPGRSSRLDAAADSLLERICEAAEAGVDVIQIRERDLPDAALLRLARRAVESSGRSRVIVNDRLDLALAAGAAGVHLRGDSFAAPRAKSLVPPGFMIGRSVHSEEEAVAIEHEGAVDYLMFGTVFPSGSKPPGHRAVGLDALRRVTAAVHVPVIAIGGITPDRVADVMAAGAAGVAAIAMFDGPGPLTPLVQRLRARV